MSHASDTQVAVDAFLAERMFVSGQLDGARELSAGFKDKLQGSVERVRLLRAQVFVTQIDVLLGTQPPEALGSLCLEVAQELSDQGATRESLTVLLQPCALLLITDETRIAMALMARAETLLSEHCPEGWHRQWRRLNRLHACVGGDTPRYPEESQPAEDVETATLEAYIQARLSGDPSACQSAIRALNGFERRLLASLLEALA